MILLQKVIDGTWEPKSYDDACEAYCLVAEARQELGKGEGNAFGFVLTMARNTYTKYFEKKGEYSASSTPWYVMASVEFKDEATRAATKADMDGWNKQGLNNYKGAVSCLETAMRNGADFLERNDATGNFVLSGKTKFEQWNRAFTAKVKAAEEAKAREDMVKAGILKPQVVAGTDVTGKPENRAQASAPSILDGASPELAAALTEYCQSMIALSKSAAVTKFKDAEETGAQKAQRLVAADLSKLGHILAQDFANLQKAANAA